MFFVAAQPCAKEGDRLVFTSMQRGSRRREIPASYIRQAGGTIFCVGHENQKNCASGVDVATPPPVQVTLEQITACEVHGTSHLRDGMEVYSSR